MGGYELLVAGERLLAEARALRAAFPDVEAMRRVPASEVEASVVVETLSAALRYLRAEVALVRSGEADCLTVLDDEIENVRRALAAV
jgi:hypothetical protein